MKNIPNHNNHVPFGQLRDLTAGRIPRPAAHLRSFFEKVGSLLRVLMALSLLHTYMLLCTIATTQKRNELTLGSSLDRVDLQL